MQMQGLFKGQGAGGCWGGGAYLSLAYALPCSGMLILEQVHCAFATAHHEGRVAETCSGHPPSVRPGAGGDGGQGLLGIVIWGGQRCCTRGDHTRWMDGWMDGWMGGWMGYL